MARIRPDQPLVPSVLDRLLDDEPENRKEVDRPRHVVLREIKQSIRRDLENLLNTRSFCRPWSPQLEQIDKSIVGYGVPDSAISGMAADDWRGALRKAIEDAIRIYEPRLTNVMVTLVEEPDSLERMLRFRIEAMLLLEAEQEVVTFDSRVETATRVVLVNR